MRINLQVILAFLFIGTAYGQCPQVYDGNGLPSANPYWISCTGNAYTLNFSSPDAVGSYTVMWGDGTADATGASLAANTIITHNYAATTDTFIVTFITSAPSCTLTGVVVMEKPVNASIQIPAGGVTAACAPATLQFINSSTNVSQTTTFTWDFGDGTPIVTYNYTNAGQTISHTYNKGTVNCQTVVTLTAENYCTFGTPTTAQFNPIQIYDIDDAAITVDAATKCWPDNSFTFTNTTDRNCLAEGNNGTRYEKWNFGDYWSLGYDSIINWTAWPPTFPKTVAYPAVGCYNVMLFDSNQCGIDTAAITVCIVNKPTAALIVNPDTVCQGFAMTFTNTSTPGNAYEWNFGDNATWTTTNYNPQTHTYASAGTYTVSVVAYVAGGANSCRDTAQLVVTVLPSPTAKFTYTPGIGCNTVTITFTDVSAGAVSWQWNLGNGNNFTGQSPPAQTYTTGTYSVSLFVTALNGCSDTEMQPVTVYQTPVPQFTTSIACANNAVQFTDQSTSATGDNIVSWNWNYGDGNAAGTQPNPLHTYTAAATYSVVLTVATAQCTDSIGLPLVVNPLPVPSFTFNPASGCPVLNVAFTNTSSGASTYSWNFGNGTTSTLASPTASYSNSTTSTISYPVTLTAVSAVGCKDSLTDSVRVFGRPVASFTSNAVAACAPFNVSFTNTSQAAVSYVWDFGDGSAASTAASPTHTYQNTTNFLQNYTVTLYVTNAGGCQDSTKQVIQAYPTAQFTFAATPDSGCGPLSVNFPAAAGAVSYQWDFGDGSTSTAINPSHTFTNATPSTQVYTVQLIAINAFNCADTVYQTVTVFAKPVASFSVSADSGCTPLPVNFTDLSAGANSYSWSFGDGVTSTVQNANHTYTSSSLVLDSFLVRLICYNIHGCSDTLSQSIYVFPKVNAAFSSDTLGCSALSVSFINATQGANAYTWDYGDGTANSSTTNPVHVYTNTTTAVVTYTATLFAQNSFGCSDTATQALTVLPKPAASFTLSAGAGCPPFNPAFTNTSAAAASYAWNFGDGATSAAANPAHTYTNTSYVSVDSFNIQLIATNSFNCTDTAYQLVYVYPQIEANFYADTPICAPVNVVFYNITQSTPVTTYTWNFGDGSPADNSAAPSHQYNNTTGAPLFYTVTLNAGNAYGCTSTFAHTYGVYPTPTASFSITPPTQTYPSSNVTIINQTPNASSFTNSWNFGDGNTSNVVNPPSHAYATWGIYTITLVVSSAFCSDSTMQVAVIIPPKPIADFTGCDQGCVPLRDSLFSTSQYATSYYWDFGDNLGVATVANPVYVYTQAGTYDIKLVVTGPGGKDSITRAGCAVVYPLPKALFTLQPTSLSVTAGTDPITCTNLSTIDATVVPPQNIASSIWNFGDGSPLVTAANPTHTYQQAGQYPVSLTVISNRGCRDSLTYYAPVTVNEDVTIEVPNGFTPSPNGASGGGVYDPTSPDNDIFHPNVNGLQTYEMNIFNRWGELLFVTKDTSVGWDGYYKGKLCEQGIYVWTIKGTTLNGRTIEQAGDLTLLR